MHLDPALIHLLFYNFTEQLELVEWLLGPFVPTLLQQGHPKQHQTKSRQLLKLSTEETAQPVFLSFIASDCLLCLQFYTASKSHCQFIQMCDPEHWLRESFFSIISYSNLHLQTMHPVGPSAHISCIRVSYLQENTQPPRHSSGCTYWHYSSLLL